MGRRQTGCRPSGNLPMKSDQGNYKIITYCVQNEWGVVHNFIIAIQCLLDFLKAITFWFLAQFCPRLSQISTVFTFIDVSCHNLCQNKRQIQLHAALTFLDFILLKLILQALNLKYSLGKLVKIESFSNAFVYRFMNSKVWCIVLSETINISTTKNWKCGDAPDNFTIGLCT